MATTLLPEDQELIILSPLDLISLREAKILAGAFAMRPLNKLHLEQLAETDPAKWPPIVVTLTSLGYVVIDGYHRWEIAKQKGWQLKATCQAFASEAAVIEAAFRANLTHGLKANMETRGDYAYWLRKSFPEMQQEEIAQRAAMTQGGVSKAISKRDALTKQLQEEEIAKERQKSIRRSCQHFTKVALGFFQEIGELADEELAQLLSGQVKTPEDRQKLARIGRLLSQEDASKTTGPLRLKQFAPGGPTTGTL